MATLAVDIQMGNLPTYIYPATPSYDSTKLGIGPGLIQQSGVNPEDNWAGPIPVAVARPYEQTTPVATKFVKVIPWSSTIDWVFLADNQTATTTYRVQSWRFDKSTGAWAYQGFITFPAGPSGNRTIRGLLIRYAKYTDGTITTSGTTTVTGSSTAWQASRLCVGSRIGFGSSDPALIQTWYQIATITNDGTLTTTAIPPTYSSPTSYVIEELFVVCAETNATPANGGIWVAKGLRIEDFNPAGTTIPLATGTDNIKACYLLKDNGTLTNTISFGIADQGADSWTQHFIWVGDAPATTTPRVFKYNLKAALSDIGAAYTSPSTAVAGAAFVLNSGNAAISTAVITQNDDLIIASPNHGPGIGIKCLYFATSTVGRLYRSKDITTITQNDGTWLSGGGVSTEVPPGGTVTFAATNAGNSLCYIPAIDKFAWFSTGATAFRSYITQYREDGAQWDRIFLNDTKQTNQANADGSAPIYPNTLSLNVFGCASGTTLYLMTPGTATNTNFLYATPIPCEEEYTSLTNSVLITPAIPTPNCNNYLRAYVAKINALGGDSGKCLSVGTEFMKIYYRTTGIDDNSGVWTLLDDTKQLLSVTPAEKIQFKAEFRCLGVTNLPTRLLAIGVIYNDLSTDSHFQPSVANSNQTEKRFAWRFSAAFNTTIPRLRIRLYNAVNGAGPLIDDDTTNHTAGTWEKSTDGGSNWVAFNNTDKTNDITYIRYTPTTLGDNIRVRALLTLY